MKTYTKPSTKTNVTIYDKVNNNGDHFTNDELINADGFIVCHPFADDDCPISAMHKDGIVALTIERDSYDIPMDDIKKIIDICEIYYLTESIEDVRNFLNINN